MIRFRLLQDLFFSYASQDIDGKLHFGYENFRLIFVNNYPETSELERIQLYRECFSVGQGAVNNENFYTVATENLFFVKHLRLSGQLFVRQSAGVDPAIDQAIKDEMIQVYKESDMFKNLQQIGYEYGVVEMA